MIIIRYRELSLKGNNRIVFERALKRNIIDCLKKHNISYKQVWRIRGRMIIDTQEKVPFLDHVFGIASYSYGIELPQDIETIKKECLKAYKQGTFRISCQRMEDFLYSSQEIEREVGAYVVEHAGAKVKLKGPDQDICVEIFNGHAYIFTEKIPGPSGLPITKESHVILILQDKNSIKAGLKMMKRGCSINIYKEKDIDYSELKEYEYGFKIKEIDHIPQDTVFIVSDTLETIKDYPYFVLRPLIGE